MSQNQDLEKIIREYVIKALSDDVEDLEREEKITQAQNNIAKWLGKTPEVLNSGKKYSGRERTSSDDKVLSKSLEDPDSIVHFVPKAQKKDKLEELLATSPARLGVWRAGTRYLTKVALKLRADHAVAKDAVYAELPPGFAENYGWVPLQTLAKDKEEFLLRPDYGRSLNEASMKIVSEKAIKNPDIQIIIADGLSPWAAERNAKPMVDELIRLLKENNFTVGTVFCVKYSRIAIQDVIGEAVGAKVSMIILGERPGLGGGDSLSNYMIYNPKVGAVNALKSMISNIHPTGHAPKDAAKLTLSMVKSMFEQKCSGINLKI
jgi:ethanolamine ammonia-lyase small subunit